MTTIIDPDNEPVEIEDGSGDLRYGSEAFTVESAFYNGRPVSYAKIYAEQPWVAIAVNRLLTWAVRVPLKVYRRLDDEGDKQRLRPGDHKLAAAFENPWPRGSQADLKMSFLGPVCVHGNSIIDIDEGARGEIRFDPLDWRHSMPNRLDQSDSNSEILGWELYTPTGGRKSYSAESVMHLRWWSPLGNLGISPLQQLRPTILSESAAMEWAINNLIQGWRPNGVVEFAEETLKLDPDKLHTLYETSIRDLRSEYGGRKNSGKIPVMPPGLKWSDAEQTTAVEAELIEQRKVNRNEVSAIYQIPPPTIGQLERATFSNIVELRQMAYTDGLAPPLILIEQLINAQVVRELLREDDVFVEFDLGVILRGDRLKEIKALREGVGMALYTPNEARGALNMPRSDEPGADSLYLPTNNLAPLSGGESEGS